VHDEHALGVVGVLAAQAVEQQAVLEVRRAQAPLASGELSELAAVMLGGNSTFCR